MQRILWAWDAGGCVDTIRQGPYLIRPPDLFIPNIFSPNEDGINDVFIVDYSGKEYFSMKIFDRWGVKMYENIGNPAIGWNGSSPGGGAASEGVYYYAVEIGDKSYTGNLTLLR